MTNRKSLRSSVNLQVEYDDRTRFGSRLSGQIEHRLKRHFQPLIDLIRRHGFQEVISNSQEHLAQFLGPGASSELYQAPHVLREEVAYPVPTQVVPSGLRVARPNAAPVTIPLPAELIGELASWISEWEQTGKAPTGGPALTLWEQLRDLDCFGPRREPLSLPCSATLVGHATVLLSTAKTRIVVDPFLFPRDDAFPPGFQPITNGDLSVDGILVTHSHRDHFHFDSLLRLGVDTPIIIPEVPRESLLSVDMAHRLKQLGFRRVTPLRWHQETTIGDFRIVALPFYGEQPTNGSALHPEIRNIGNTYLVEGGGRRYGLVADAGRDRLGDVPTVAADALAKYGPLDVLFGGYRAFALYPPQYVFSSVPEYLLFVPPPLWGMRQQVMNDAHALLDTAERWHARHVVPYADGGAPWYWNLNLGARSDAVKSQNPHFDPRPEAVLTAAAQRSSSGDLAFASPVRTLIMRPGEYLEFDDAGNASVRENEGHRWPYHSVEAAVNTHSGHVEPVALTRKRVLLRLLAREELKRRSVEIDVHQLQTMSDELRRANRLSDRRAMQQWIDRTGLSLAEYSEILLDWQSVSHLEGLLADEIERRVSGQLAFASMRSAAVP